MEKTSDRLQKRRDYGSVKYTLASFATIAIFLVGWWALVRFGIVPSNKVPAPLTVLEAFINKLSSKSPDGATLPVNILTSLQVSMTGLVIAICIGIPLGLLMGWYKLFERFVKILFEILRPIPPIAWIPLAILWFGVGLRAKAAIIFLSAFVPCVLNSYTGIRQTSLTLINVGKTFGASNFYIFIHIGVPSSVPMIFAGLRIALSNSWATLVAAEMVAASSGLGYMINMSRNFGRIDVVLVGMICIGALGAMLTWLFGKIEAAILKGKAYTNG